MTGVGEESAEFRYPIDLKTNLWRSIAGVGPVYEIIEDKGEFVRVRILHSDEEFDYRRSDAELDPPA